MVSFVFLDGKSYVLDNLMRLKTVPLLYYLARKKRKRFIYIIRSGSKEGVDLFLSDSASADLINVRQSQGFFRKNPVGRVYQPGERNSIDLQGEAFEELMCVRLPRVLREQENAAVLIDLSVFVFCFRNMPSFRETYLQLSDAGKVPDDSICLVVENQENLPDLFTGEHSIFKVKDLGRSLSPELAEIMEKTPEAPLFQEMQKRMGTRCFLLKDYDENGVRNTFLRVLLHSTDVRFLSREELERMTQFLMRCRQSMDYRLQAGEIGGVCDAASTEELEQLLMQTGVLEEVRVRAGQLSQEDEKEERRILPEWMERSTQCIEILKGVHILDPEMEEQAEGINNRLEGVIRELSCVRASEDDRETEDNLKEIAEIMERSAAKGDYLTVERGLEVLEGWIVRRPDTPDDILQKQIARLSCSARLFQLNHDILQCRIELSEESERQKQSRKEAAAFISRYPWLKTVVGKMKSSSSGDLDADTHMKLMEFTELTREAARHDASLRAMLSRLHSLQQEYEQESRQMEQLKYMDFIPADQRG